jgi:hypothetical protein
MLLSYMIFAVSPGQVPYPAHGTGSGLFEGGWGRREVEVSRDTVVAEHNVAIRVEEDVARFDITVNDLPFVKLLQGDNQLSHDHLNLSWSDIRGLIHKVTENPAPERFGAPLDRSSEGHQITPSSEVHQEVIVRGVLPAANKAAQPVRSSGPE